MKRYQKIKAILALMLVMSLFIPVSLSDADINTKGKKDSSVQMAGGDAITLESAEDEKGSTEWKKAPTGLKAEVKGGTVTLSWKHARNTDRYVVYEVMKDKEKEVATSTSRKAELTNVKPGKHEYRVTPQKKSGKKWKTGEASKSVTVTVEDWAAAPTKAEGSIKGLTVTLKWEYAGKAKAFSVYEVTDGEAKLVATVSGKKKCSFSVTDGGTHRYYVAARKKADGKWAEGDRSKTVKVKVEDYEKGGVLYALTDGHWIVKKLTKENVKSVTIPEEILGLKVTAIGESAFAKQTNLKKIDLPDTITEIGKNAFDQCTSLEIMD